MSCTFSLPYTNACLRHMERRITYRHAEVDSLNASQKQGKTAVYNARLQKLCSQQGWGFSFALAPQSYLARTE